MKRPIAFYLASGMLAGTYPITKSDDDFNPDVHDGVACWVYAQEAGTIHYIGIAGDEDTLTVAANTWHHICARRIFVDSTVIHLHGGIVE
jgi:hypothetical protein